MSELPHRLGQILIQQGKITELQLTQALALQQTQGGPIGNALIALDFVNQTDVSRALRKQTWLRPCAACLTFLLAPFSYQCCAYEDNVAGQQIHQMDNSGWNENIHASSLMHKDAVKVVLKAAWQAYQGAGEELDTKAHWNYSLSQQKDGYRIHMNYKF